MNNYDGEDRRKSNDVILEKIAGLKTLIEEKFDTNEKSHASIIVQTTKTNGRVSSLEKWQNMVIGAVVIINIFVVPVLLWLVMGKIKG